MGLEIKVLDICTLGQIVASCAIISLDTYAGMDGLPSIWFSSCHLIFPFSKSSCQTFLRCTSKVSCDFWKSGHQPSDPAFSAVDIIGVYFWKKSRNLELLVSWILLYIMTSSSFWLLLSRFFFSYSCIITAVSISTCVVQKQTIEWCLTQKST